MDAFYIAGVIAVAILVAASVSFFTRQIFGSRTLFADRLNKLAGVRRIDLLAETGPYESFRRVLSSRPPTKRLDILAVSGWSVFKPEILQPLLESGVEIRALLLNPAFETSLLKEEQWLASETRETLDVIRPLARSSSSLRIRFYQGLQLQMLLFVDDDRLFLSSFFPVTSRPRLVFEIAPGEKSLYQIYREAFEYVWERAMDAEYGEDSSLVGEGEPRKALRDSG